MWLKPIGSVQRLAATWPVQYSLCEPSELSQWLCHDDSTINTVVAIIIIIIELGSLSYKYQLAKIMLITY